MIWKNFKSNIINLGFEEVDIFDDAEQHLVESANRGIIYINSFLERKKKIEHIDIPENTKYFMIDLSVYEDFDSVCDVPPKIQGKPLADYYYENDILYINAPGKNVSITYNPKTELIPYDVDDNYILPIKQELIPLLQLITAYYVWLDDDERKATCYYDQYQELANNYISLKNLEKQDGFTASVEGGIEI